VPNSSETYVHRIGRTGRVGRTGRAITFVTPDQKDEIARIERDVKTKIGEWETPEERLEHAPPPRRRERTPRREREKEKEPRREREQAAEANGDGGGEKADTTKLFVNRGERSGIGEEDLRWALREGAVLPEEAIHDVRVLHRFSFVEVDPDQAERTVEFLDGTKLKGKEIRLEIAKS
jgi:ATP-dependent RNA helicase DeaD